MSSNESIGSNITNITDVYVYSYKLPVIYYINCGVSIVVIVVGTLLNLWFLVAILCSQDTRSRLRNKIICNSLVLHLVDSVIILPIEVKSYFGGVFGSCVFYSVYNHLTLIQDFIGNWLLVMLLVVFIAQIEDFNPKIKLSPKTTILSTGGLLVFPWMAALVLVPVIINGYYTRTYNRTYCPFPTGDAIEVFKSFDTAAPILLVILLLIVAVFLRYRRFTRGYTSRSMQTELISRGPEIDNSIAYIVATAVCILCDILQLIHALDLHVFLLKYGYKTGLTLYLTSYLMSNLRALLMPLPWLLLPDIRQQIRTWRPWYRPAPAIDLTVTYKKEEN